LAELTDELACLRFICWDNYYINSDMHVCLFHAWNLLDFLNCKEKGTGLSFSLLPAWNSVFPSVSSLGSH